MAGGSLSVMLTAGAIEAQDEHDQAMCGPLSGSRIGGERHCHGFHGFASSIVVGAGPAVGISRGGGPSHATF